MSLNIILVKPKLNNNQFIKSQRHLTSRQKILSIHDSAAIADLMAAGRSRVFRFRSSKVDANVC